MEVLLLGTGGADGWPNPFCGCASCALALARGEVRGQSAALVDGRLLLDCGPEAPRAALRHGRSLREVEAILLTHAHPDHCGPAVLMWRGWVERNQRLTVVGPPAALAACRDWLGPADPVDLVEARAGATLDVAGYLVDVLPATHGDEAIGPAVLYAVTDAEGHRLLYATDTGPLPDAAVTAGPAYDVVLMEETFGEQDGAPTGHLDLRSWPRQVARLRDAGRITERTRLHPTHLGHRNPPRAELAARFAAWGAELLDDGAVISTSAAVCAPQPPSRVLVTGGARSGKSTYAESLLLAEPAVTYVATSAEPAGDAEWAARVASHRSRRPGHWRTVETLDLVEVLRATTTAVLVDCVTLWLTGVLDRTDGWSGGQAWQRELDRLVAAVDERGGRTVLVTNEVGSGVVPDTASGRLFRDALGLTNAALARACESVVHVVAGMPTELRATAR